MNKRFFIPASLFIALFVVGCGDDSDPGFDGGPCALGACTDASPLDTSTDSAGFDAGRPGDPELTAPVPGSTLSGPSQLFEWTGGGEAARVYDLWVGSTLGGSEYADSEGLETTQTFDVSGLPEDGSVLYIRLHWSDDGWDTVNTADYTVHAAPGDAAECGNGSVEATEQCDDGNRVSGDGCSDSCRDESTMMGEGEVGGASASDTCGNGVREPTEPCDDGNTTAGDGCSAICSVERSEVAGAYYVTTAGNDGNDGRSEANAFRTITHGVGVLSAGDTLYVKAGDYGNEEVSINASGSEAAPIVIEGYRVTPGDSPRIQRFDHTSEHDASVMPLLRGSSRASGVSLRVHGDYVHLRNIQVTNFFGGVYVYGSYDVVDNVLATNFGDLASDYSGGGFWLEGHHNTARNTVMVDAGGQGVTIQGHHHVYEFSKIYGTSNADANGMDYYLIIDGQTMQSDDNLVRNNYMERVGNVEHGGHGFNAEGDVERNLFENNTAVNLNGGGFMVRHSEVENNVFRNNTILGGYGLLARDGAHDNLFENIRIIGARYPFWFIDTLEDPLNTEHIGGESNTFRNITIEDTRDSVFYFVGHSGRENTRSRDNVFENITLTGGAEFMFAGDHRTMNNVIRNSSFEGIERWGFSRTIDIADLDVVFENTSCTDCGFELP